jgi:hypothetical protein
VVFLGMKENEFEFKWTQVIGGRRVIKADNIEEAKRLFYNSTPNVKPNSVEIRFKTSK